MKLLLSAFACEPDRGSEPGIGWGVVSEAARRHTVWALVNTKHRDAIQQHLSRHALPNVTFEYLCVPQPLRCVENLPVFHVLGYIAWEIRAYFRSLQLHRQVNFDLVH